jgi:hypothetical protein
VACSKRLEDGTPETVSLDGKLAIEWEKHHGLYVTTCNKYRDVNYEAAALKSIAKEIAGDHATHYTDL